MSEPNDEPTIKFTPNEVRTLRKCLDALAETGYGWAVDQALIVIDHAEARSRKASHE